MSDRMPRPRLSEFSRLLLVQRVLAGQPVAHVAASMGVSRATAYKWLHRFQNEGPHGLQDRSSRPHHRPNQLPPEVEQQVLAARAEHRVGPVRLAALLDLNPSTVGRVLRRHRVPLLSHLDPTTGVLLRGQRSSDVRYEYTHAGGLIHIDIKQLGRVPDGGGWRAHGRSEEVRGRFSERGKASYEYVHSAVDDHSRLAYSEIHDDQRGDTCAGFLQRALAFFARHGIAVQRVMTDNAFAYKYTLAWKQVLLSRGIKHVFIKPHCPWTNGKVERFNRTLQSEWAYRRPFTTNEERRQALDTWLIEYNRTRPHRALNGSSPLQHLSTR